MKKLILFALIFVIKISGSLAINPIITVTGILPPTGCAGGTIMVTYTDSGGTFNTGCTFKVQLSNGFGQFTAPVDIGTSPFNTGAILCNIPSGTPLGVLYRVRVVASNPADTSAPSAITTPLVITTPPTPTITATPDAPICEGDSIKLTCSLSLRYSWSNGDTLQTTYAKSSGNYICSVTLAGSCSASSAPKSVTVNPAPLPLIINLGATLIAPTADSYQWNESGNPISGATSQSYTPSTPGSYTVTVTYSNGCSRTSDPLLSTGIEDELQNQYIRIFPNPADKFITIGFHSTRDEMAHIYISDVCGKKLQEFNSVIRSGSNQMNIETEKLSSGIYFIEIQSEGAHQSGKIFIQ